VIDELDFPMGLKLIKNARLSVTSISSNSFEARELKFGRNNPHMNDLKSTRQKFEILFRS